MNEARGLWALFLAVLVGYAFQSAWKRDHGFVWNFLKDGSQSVLSTIWINPLCLPFLLLFYSLLTLRYPVSAMGFIVDTLLFCGFHSLLVMLVLPLCRRFFSARACAALWLLPAFALYLPHTLLHNGFLPPLRFYVPRPLLNALFFLWLGGFCICMFVQVRGHLRFRRRLLVPARPVEEEAILDIWKEECAAALYREPVSLVRSPLAHTPLSMGLLKKSLVTVLPERDFSAEELRFIFRHEIRHLARDDVSNKAFFAFYRAFCWFNPFIWTAIRKASADLELSCDERVLEEADEAARRRYAELLLQTAGEAQGFSTCLSASARSLRYRLQNVIKPHNPFLGVLLLSFSMFLCVLAYGFVGLSSDAQMLGASILPPGSQSLTPPAFSMDAEGDSLAPPGAEAEERLFAYLRTLEASRHISANQIIDTQESVPWLNMYYGTPDGRKLLLSLDDEKLILYHMYDRRARELYFLRAPIDWAEIAACFAEV